MEQHEDTQYENKCNKINNLRNRNVTTSSKEGEEEHNKQKSNTQLLQDHHIYMPLDSCLPSA